MREEFIPFPPKSGNMPFFVKLAGMSYCDGNYEIRRNDSPVCCIEYIISGTGTVLFSGEEFHPKKGDIYLLPPGKDHIYFSDAANPWTKIWVNAEGILVDKLLSIYNPQNTVLFSNVENGFELLKKIHETGTNPDVPFAKKHECAAIYFHELLQFLYTDAQKETLSSEIRFLKEYIDAHITENIPIKSLCDMVYLSESQVIRSFKKYLGKTPYEYMLDLKIENAKSLLAGTRLMIKEIAYNLSFCDEHYFSYIFKKKTGKTPTQYRNS